MNERHGGPAFPQGVLDATSGYRQTEAAAECGMSLRDYFAAQIASGYVSGSAFAVDRRAVMADPRFGELVYAAADLMLKERIK